MRIYYCKLNDLGQRRSTLTKQQIALHSNDQFSNSNFRVDYIAWNGANPDLCIGKKGLAKGPDTSLRTSSRSIGAQGPNSDHYKGPKIGLAKGSIYSQLKMKVPNVKCN